MFQAQRLCYKKKFKLVSEQQIQYYYEALFLICIQIIFCVSILVADFEDKEDQIKSFEVPSIAI